ncbi:hypothetical protein [Bordetella muralis]|uniref:hypothetical protein n=1 Tax=Bordetella muralis TaxID=1649130 RepID=UPI0039F0F746
MKPESTEWACARYVRHARVLLAIVGLTCVLAGCGSGSDDDSNDNTGTPPDTSTPDTSTPPQLRCAP